MKLRLHSKATPHPHRQRRSNAPPRWQTSYPNVRASKARLRNSTSAVAASPSCRPIVSAFGPMLMAGSARWLRWRQTITERARPQQIYLTMTGRRRPLISSSARTKQSMAGPRKPPFVSRARADRSGRRRRDGYVNMAGHGLEPAPVLASPISHVRPAGARQDHRCPRWRRAGSKADNQVARTVKKLQAEATASRRNAPAGAEFQRSSPRSRRRAVRRVDCWR